MENGKRNLKKNSGLRKSRIHLNMFLSIYDMPAWDGCASPQYTCKLEMSIPHVTAQRTLKAPRNNYPNKTKVYTTREGTDVESFYHHYHLGRRRDPCATIYRFSPPPRHHTQKKEDGVERAPTRGGRGLQAT